jgi:hypothetical protein
VTRAIWHGGSGYSRVWPSMRTRDKEVLDAQREPANCVCASAAMHGRRPDDVLFVHESAYTWRALDEDGIGCHWVGGFDDARGTNAAPLRRQAAFYRVVARRAEPPVQPRSDRPCDAWRSTPTG